MSYLRFYKHLGNAFPAHQDAITYTSKTLDWCHGPEPGNRQQNKVFGGVITPFEQEQTTHREQRNSQGQHPNEWLWHWLDSAEMTCAVQS